MDIRFLIDRDTGLPHCVRHGVSPQEAIDVVQYPAERSRGVDGAIVVAGQTRAGRYLRVVYRELADALLIITAYDLVGNARKAFRRRRRR